MRHTARQTRDNRTITVDFRDDATYYQLLGNGKVFVECARLVLSLGFQLTHKASCSEGRSLTRPSHYARVRLGGLTIWRLQCPACKAVFTVLPHFVLRYRQMRPTVARDALLATRGGLSLERCAVLYHISPMALYRLICALGQRELGDGAPPGVVSHCLPRCWPTRSTAAVSPPKSICPRLSAARVLWHLGYTEEASTAALTQSYGVLQRAASPQDPILSCPRGAHRWL